MHATVMRIMGDLPGVWQVCAWLIPDRRGRSAQVAKKFTGCPIFAAVRRWAEIVYNTAAPRHGWHLRGAHAEKP